MTGTGPVGVGIIGAGVISDQYLSNIVTFPDLKPLFVADIDLGRAAAQAAKYGIPGSGSVEELLAHPEIEIVVNLTIPAAHTEVATRAVAAGKSVWTEKPFSLDRPSGLALLDAAKAAGLRVACAPDTILGAGLQSARRLIESGEIGAPLTGLTLFQSAGPESWHPSPEFLFAVGGGPLFDIGPYYLTTLVQIFGPVAKVTATSSTARPTRVIGSGPRAGTVFPVEVPTHFSVLIQFEGGQSAVSVFSFQSGLTRGGVVEIAGVDGTAVLPDPNVFDGDTVVWRDRDSSETFAPEGASLGRGTGVVELAQAIRAGRPERASGELGYHVLDTMVSIAESAERDEPVAVASTVVLPPALPADWDPRVATL
ncbi:MAG TPA: Gfo/Idh/MocA family oxidoreductase [Lacisediminihabitans sp.]|uniref:Gfo/Idh/MocA family protein n=1 Tax=Lacisediminihabitans sp. TaxID=2787631 RepID=UPI002ED8A708